MFNQVIEKLINLEGLEFGGPTELFINPVYGMPLYENVKLDGVNIFEDNFFQKSFSDKFNYSFGQGIQYNIDCTDTEISSKINKKYDFIVTSHVIEHIANPMKAILSWKKLLKEEGFILSIIPDYKYCYDRKRLLTPINHIINDYKNNVGEDDTTHIEEYKQKYDWTFEIPDEFLLGGGREQYYKLCDNNAKTRVIHHHTFDLDSFKLLMDAVGLTSILYFKQCDLNIVNLSYCKN